VVALLVTGGHRHPRSTELIDALVRQADEFRVGVKPMAEDAAVTAEAGQP